MFSLSKSARRNIRIVSLGAAAASAAVFCPTVKAIGPDDIYWDPGATFSGTGSGGNGSFDNTTENFFNSRYPGESSAIWTGWNPGMGPDPVHPNGTHAGYWFGDKVHFAGTAGTVTVSTDTRINHLYVDTAGYTISGAQINLGGGYTVGAYTSSAFPKLAMTTTGTSTITSTLHMPGTGSSAVNTVEVVTGGTLVVSNITTAGGYGHFQKTGGGTLDITGTYTTAGSVGMYIDAGTVVFHGTGNTIQNGLSPYAGNRILSGATLAGTATIALNSSQWTIAGNVAPGFNPANNLGDIGTLTLDRGNLNFGSTSHLVFDIATDGLTYDKLALTGSATTRNIVISSGAVIDINGGTGTLTPGTYNIITNNASGNIITNNGLAVGVAPSGYTYSFVTLPGNAGIDLVIGVLAGSTWTANAGAGNWSDSGNWSGSVPDASGATATFGTGTLSAVNVDGARIVGNIQYSGANSYTITGSTLVMDNSGSQSVVSVLGGTQSIGSALALLNDLEVSNDPTGGTINISGGITGTGNIVLKNKSSLANAITLSGAEVNNTGTITNNGLGTGNSLISAVIGSNVTTITQASATSALVLTGNNTGFAGTTIVGSGTLSFANNALGTTGVINFNGGVLQWQPGNTQDVSSRFDTAAASPVKVDVNGNTVTFAAPLTSTTTSTLNVSSTAANGTLVVTGAQTYTGVTTIESGTLRLASGASLNYAASNPVVNAAGTFDINGNNTTIGGYGIGTGGITNNGTVTNTGAQATLTLTYKSFGTGTYNGNMDLLLDSPGGGEILIGTANNSGTITTATTWGYYRTRITNVGSNVTAVTQNFRYGTTITNLATNAGGTTLTANHWTEIDESILYPTLVVENTVTGNGDLIIAGDSQTILQGGLNMAGKLIHNSTFYNPMTINGAIGSNVTGITQNSTTSILYINGAMTVNGSGTTIVRGDNAQAIVVTSSTSGTGDLILQSNEVDNVQGITMYIGTLNHTGKIINSGTGGAYTTLSGYAGGSVGTNVTGITQNSATSSILVTGALNVNASGTTLENNGGAGLNTYNIVGTGNVITKNNTAIDNNIYLGSVNNAGTLTNSGTGGGYVSLSLASVGTLVTGVVQNSATSDLVVVGTGTSTAPLTSQLGRLEVGGNHAGSATAQSGATIAGNGTVASLNAVSGGHIAPNGLGTLNTGTLTLAAGSNLDYGFDTPGNSSSITVSGGAATVTLSSGIVLNLIGSAATLGSGSYTLIGYGDTDPLAGWADSSGSINGGVVSNTTAGTIILGNTGWTTAGNFNFTITNDAANGDVLLTLAAIGGPAGSGTWTAVGGTGLWSDSANWNPSSPNGAGLVATFDGTGTLAAVNVDGGKTVGAIAMSGAVDYTLSGSAITLDNTTGTGDASISSSSAGTQTIASQVIVANTALNVTATGGTLNLSGGIDNTAGLAVAITANGGNVNVGAVVNNGAVTVAGPNTVSLGAVSGTGSVTQNSGTLVMNAVNSYGGGTTLNGGTFGGSGTVGAVNAGSGAHTIHPSATLSPSTATTLSMSSLATSNQTTIKVNLGTGGASDVIAVSGNLNIAAGTTMDVSNHATGAASLGYFNVMTYGSLTGSVGSVVLPANTLGVNYFLTTAHAANTVSLHRGYLGDANDTGFVDLTDLTTLAASWQQAGTWENGDFNNSNFIDLTDLTILAGAWQTGISAFGAAAASIDAPASFQAAVNSIVFGASAVPEPTSLTLLGLGAVGLLGRRRRKA